jgi:triacylglycerol lipase
MNEDLREQHRMLGRALGPDMIKATCELAAPLQPELASGYREQTDIPYGPDERHRIDLFLPDALTAATPTLLFVHGGGFVGGDKAMASFPFYRNIGIWAARQGWIGATMTYRRAPDHTWPSGAEDVGRAVAKLAELAREAGANPNGIFLLGQSAGAVHVADYIAQSQLHGAERANLAGAIMASPIYDVGRAEHNRMQEAYFGPDQAKWSNCAALPGLLKTDLPMLFSVCEFDIPDFEKQAAMMVAAWHEHHGSYPPLLRLTGHNHLSNVLHIGAQGDNFGPEIALFVNHICA